jgi:hypothetical protein
LPNELSSVALHFGGNQVAFGSDSRDEPRGFTISRGSLDESVAEMEFLRAAQ